MQTVKRFTPRVTAGVHSVATAPADGVLRTVSARERALSADELRLALRQSRARTIRPRPESGRVGNIITRIDHKRSRAPEHLVEYLADAVERGAPQEDVEAVGLVIVERARGWYGNTAPNARELQALVLDEVRADAESNPAQIAAAFDTGCRRTLAEAERATARELGTLGRLLAGLRAALHRTPAPAGAAVTPPLRSA